MFDTDDTDEMGIMPHHRDKYGFLAVYDRPSGKYRFLTAAERQVRYEQDAAERQAREEFNRAHPKTLADYVPHEGNCNRVSYGRADPDSGCNWPQRLDGTCPKS